MENNEYAKSLEIANYFEERYTKKGYKIKKEFDAQDKLSNMWANSEKRQYNLQSINSSDTYVIYQVYSLVSKKGYCLFKYNILDDGSIEEWDTEKKYNTPNEMFEVADKRERELDLK